MASRTTDPNHHSVFVKITLLIIVPKFEGPWPALAPLYDLPDQVHTEKQFFTTVYNI